MAVLLDSLVPRLKATLNVPGETGLFNFDAGATTAWVEALGTGFWWARVRGFFTSYRVSLDNLTIENVVGGDDLPPELQQIVVLFTALNALEAKFASLYTVERDSAKPGLETERQRSAKLLSELLAARRSDLAELKVLLVGGVWGTDVVVIDQFLARDTRLQSGAGTFVNG